MATFRDVISEALQEITVVDPIDPVPAEMAAKGLSRLNQLLDEWNADSQTVYGNVFSTFTLTPNLQPHTIGPTGSLVLSSRPASVASVSLVLNSSTPSVYTPVTVRDSQWWADNAVPGLTSAYPTDVFYDQTFPNGSLYFWPVPTTAYPVSIQTSGVLAQVTLDTVVSLPPGYRGALMLTLAERLAPSFGATVSPETKEAARSARSRVFATNGVSRRLVTADAGIPGSGGHGGWNYRTRSYQT